MKIDIMNKEGMVLLQRNSGETMRVAMQEFWDIVRAGVRLDVQEELENCLTDCGEIEGVTPEMVRENAAFMDAIIDKVLEIRDGNEHGGQVYDAIVQCLKVWKDKDGLFVEKSLCDMEVADFKDIERRKAFDGLQHEYRDLMRQMHEELGKPFGVDMDLADSLKLRIGHVTTDMDLLRVKEWLSKQPDVLDTESPQYREAMDMMEEICGWSFPALAGMVFDGEDIDLIFREPHDSGLYVWAYYNPDANAGGQIVECSFSPADSLRISEAAVPAEAIDANHTYLSDINRKGFFLTLFDMLKMKEEGHYLGNSIGDTCRRIVDVNQHIFASFQEGRSSFELGGWGRGSVVVYCVSDLFSDKKVHFVTEESKFFYDMERVGQGPAHRHIAEKLTEYVMSGELRLREDGPHHDVEASAWHGEVDIPVGFLGTNTIEKYGSAEIAALDLIRVSLQAAGFQDVSVEVMGCYKDSVGLSFSFSTAKTRDETREWLQKALGDLRFEACSDLRAPLEQTLDDAKARAGECCKDGQVPELDI